MKSRLTRVLIAGLLSAVVLTDISVFAQQAGKTRQTDSGTISTSVSATADNAGARRQGESSVALRYLVEQALERNPEIKAMARSFDMMRARIPQAKALPEPMLEVGYLGNINPIPPFDIQKGDPSSARMLSFSQELPFPGKLGLKSQMAATEAESEWWNYEQTRLNVIAEIKDAYFDLFYLTKALETVTKNKDLLGKFAKIAEARYSVGKGIQQDVLKAQVEISKLIEQSTMLLKNSVLSFGEVFSLPRTTCSRLWRHSSASPSRLRGFVVIVPSRGCGQSSAIARSCATTANG